MKKGLFAVLILSLILVSGIEGCASKLTQCSANEDCVKVTTTCCPCEMGGEEKCVLKGTEKDYIPKDCPEGLMCIALYNCKIESCLCEEGKCKEKLIEE